MRIPRTPFAAAAALLLSACATSGQYGDPDAIAGCYYFEQDAVARELGLPWGIRLRQQPLEGWPALTAAYEVRVATTLTGASEVDTPFAYWRTIPGDSLLVGYPRGGSLDLHLVTADGGLTGIARAIGDATLDAVRPTYPVRLVRARCPEEL